MNLNVYIVKQGTPESRLLSRAGFDRTALPVAEWKGKKRSRGGYGKAPVAWRVEGEENIRILCEAVVSIIGTKTPSDRTAEEQSTLVRVTAVLNALTNREAKEQTEVANSAVLKAIIGLYLCRYCPCAGPDEIDKTSIALSQSGLGSLEELNDQADKLLGGRVAIWVEARKAFIGVMTI